MEVQGPRTAECVYIQIDSKHEAKQTVINVAVTTIHSVGRFELKEQPSRKPEKKIQPSFQAYREVDLERGRPKLLATVRPEPNIFRQVVETCLSKIAAAFS